MNTIKIESDADVIDLTHLTYEEYKNKLRQLDKHSTSPCVACARQDYCGDFSIHCRRFSDWKRRVHYGN